MLETLVSRGYRIEGNLAIGSGVNYGDGYIDNIQCQPQTIFSFKEMKSFRGALSAISVISVENHICFIIALARCGLNGKYRMQSGILKKFIEDGGLVIRASGDCMTGTFADGAELRIERKTLYLPGDVVIYARDDDTLVAHRLLGYLPGRRGWRVLTQADNAPRADHPAVFSRVLGYVTQLDGSVLACPLSRRVLAFLAYVPAVVGWLQRRRAKQTVIL